MGGARIEDDWDDSGPAATWDVSQILEVLVLHDDLSNRSNRHLQMNTRSVHTVPSQAPQTLSFPTLP